MTYMDISWIGCGLSKEPSILFLEITMRRIADVTEALSGVRIGKDTVSRLVERQEKRKAWRKRPLEEKKAYPYLYSDATYLKSAGARASST
jgi:transposase-like protein